MVLVEPGDCSSRESRVESQEQSAVQFEIRVTCGHTSLPVGRRLAVRTLLLPGTCTGTCTPFSSTDTTTYMNRFLYPVQYIF